MQDLLQEQEQLQSRRVEICSRLQRAAAAAAAVTATASRSNPGTAIQGSSRVAGGGGEDAEAAVMKWRASFEWDERVTELARSVFGVQRFRLHQREVRVETNE